MGHNSCTPLPVALGPRGGHYRSTPAGLVLSLDEESEVALTNFTVSVVARRTLDDGGESQTYLDLEANGPMGCSRFSVTPREYERLSWISDHVPGGLIWPGVSRDHVRAAITLLSTPEQRTTCTHLGWRKNDGRWVYLHAGGGISENGQVDDVHVQVEAPLDRFMLPPPPSGTDLVRCVKTSMEFLRLAPGRITVPLLAAAVLSVISPGDFGLHIAATSGRGKSQLAAITSSFVASKISVGTDLPASWSSTANANQALAYYAKDSLLCVDDWVPGTRQGDEATMDLLIRSQGNGAGRARLGGKTFTPRGMLLSTGEASPSRPSLLARLLVLRLGDQLNWAQLDRCQHEAGRGTHAAMMAAFIRWLAPRLDEIRDCHAALVAEHRRRFDLDGLHRRTSDAIAQGFGALIALTNWMCEVAVLSPTKRRSFLAVVEDRLRACARDQLEVQIAQDPAALFLARLRGAITSGEAHISRRGTPGGVCIGFDHDGISMLDPAVALRVARCGSPAEALAISPRRLGAALHTRGALARVDTRGDRVRFQIRVVEPGVGERRLVWALAPGVL